MLPRALPVPWGLHSPLRGAWARGHSSDRGEGQSPQGDQVGVGGPRALPAHPSLLPQEELDLSCTFVCKAREKAGVRLPPPGSDQFPGTQNVEPSRKVPEKASGEPVGRPVSPQPLQARPPSPSTVEQSLALAGQCRDPQRGEGRALGALPASAQLRGAVLGELSLPMSSLTTPCHLPRPRHRGSPDGPTH